MFRPATYVPQKTRCSTSDNANAQPSLVNSSLPMRNVVGFVLFPAILSQIAARSVPEQLFRSCPQSLSENAHWRENNFGRSAPVLGRSNVALREPLEKPGAFARWTLLWPRTATLRPQIFQRGF